MIAFVARRRVTRPFGLVNLKESLLRSLFDFHGLITRGSFKRAISSASLSLCPPELLS